jgi:hypothetical protein
LIVVAHFPAYRQSGWFDFFPLIQFFSVRQDKRENLAALTRIHDPGAACAIAENKEFTLTVDQ